MVWVEKIIIPRQQTSHINTQLKRHLIIVLLNGLFSRDKQGWSEEIRVACRRNASFGLFHFNSYSILIPLPYFYFLPEPPCHVLLFCSDPPATFYFWPDPPAIFCFRLCPPQDLKWNSVQEPMVCVQVGPDPRLKPWVDPALGLCQTGAAISGFFKTGPNRLCSLNLHSLNL